MSQRWALFALGAMLIIAAGPAAAGSLRVCRGSRFIEPAQSRIDAMDIRLPPLMWFDDYGTPGDALLAHNWQLSVIALKPIELRPHVHCVTVPAALAPSSKVRSVAEADQRILIPVGVAKPNGSFDETYFDNSVVGAFEDSEMSASVVGTLDNTFFQAP